MNTTYISPKHIKHENLHQLAHSPVKSSIIKLKTSQYWTFRNQIYIWLGIILEFDFFLESLHIFSKFVVWILICADHLLSHIILGKVSHSTYFWKKVCTTLFSKRRAWLYCMFTIRYIIQLLFLLCKRYFQCPKLWSRTWLTQFTAFTKIHSPGISNMDIPTWQ